MRLFAALLLPDDVRDALAASVARARALAPSLRWTQAEQWHVTVAFFGDVPVDRLDDLRTRLARSAARSSPLSLCLSSPGTFGSVRRARVLWQGVDGDVDALRALAASCRAAGRRIGLSGDGVGASARFRPHITLARVTPPGNVSDAVTALTTDVCPCWRADDLALVRSDLGAGPGGRAQHTVLSQWSLGPDSGER